MDDWTAPSFSLGLDFEDSQPSPITITITDDDDSPSPSPPTHHPLRPNPLSFDAHDDCASPPPPRPLKRLCRGPPSKPVTSLLNQEEGPLTVDPGPQASKAGPTCGSALRVGESFWGNVDDEIEDLSEEEEDKHSRDEPPQSMQYRSLCSSSKLSLSRHRILTSQSKRKRKDVSSAPPLSHVDNTSINSFEFPKLTGSPLRKFQLIDSDDPCDKDSTKLHANVAGSSSKVQHLNSGQQCRGKTSGNVSHSEDLWNSFCPDKSFHILTPAFDEVCDEYFRSKKDKMIDDPKISKGCYESSNITPNNAQQTTVENSHPPAQSYFFHQDTRIQSLVRTRLPHFFPLCAGNTGDPGQPSTSAIDYLGQFNQGQSSKQSSGKLNAETRPAKSRRNSKKTGVEEVSEGSGSWVNPKSVKEIPKDAGKRRVQANGQTTGHWYTGSNGKRVYVTKTGQELTGQLAYRQYKKESQGGFKSRKKSGSKERQGGYNNGRSRKKSGSRKK